MTQDDLLLLAHILSRVRGVTLGTVSKWATHGSNRLLFERLAAGHGCSKQTVQRAAAWFATNWPAPLEWPPGIPRQEPLGAR
jgi:hypothetical protein